VSIACPILLQHGIGEVTTEGREVAAYCLNCKLTVCVMDEKKERPGQVAAQARRKLMKVKVME
jgi:hypothetical protein